MSLTRELLSSVWATYQLDGQPPVVEPAHGDGIGDLGGGSNLNLFATQSRRPVVVRVYRPSVGPARLAELQRIRDLLREARIPTPSLVPTANGQRWLSFGGRLVEVEEYVQHDANMDTWQRLIAGLPILGRIHSVLDGVDATYETRCPAFANAVDAADARAVTTRGVARIRSWVDVDVSVRRMCDEAEELADLVAAAEGDTPPTHRQLVHGDFWDNNVLFRSGQVAAVIDFDFLGHRPRVDDLALTLFFADLTLEPADSERIPLLRSLVDSYDTGLDQPLTPDERAAIPAALARQQLWAFGHITRLDEESARGLAKVLVGELRRTLPIARNLDRWRNAFT
jgi:homoserine kinase type II